jgi:phosphate:Na+ symporter
MLIKLIIGMVGGLGLFLYGMRVMSDGLKNLAGPKMRNILEAFTRSRFTAALVGVGVTCLVQSSSATTVLVVGLVNAGLLALRQAIGVIMGANIGTTLTAWVVSLTAVKIEIMYYAFPAIGLGFALFTFAKTTRKRQWGEVLLGFGILFLGLSLLKEAFNPLRDNENIVHVFEVFSRNPLLGVLVGMVATILLQSSSASIAIIQFLALSGALQFDAAIPLILGDNIGTTVTAQLAAIGGSTNGRRAARAHALFNIFGVLYMLPLVWIGWYGDFIDSLIPGDITTDNIMVYIALSHTVFNVVNTCIFFPLVGLLEKISIKITKQGDDLDMETTHLSPALLDNPVVALEQAKMEVIRMAGLAKSSILNAQTAFFKPDLKLFAKVSKQEDGIDRLQVEITSYLVSISEHNLNPPESEEIPVLLHSVNDLERVGDHAENIVELARRKMEEKLPFTEEGVKDLHKVCDTINEMIDHVIKALESMDKQEAKHALKCEQNINDLQILFKERHLQRMTNQQCHVISGIIFLEFVSNMEKIGDHLTNVAEAVLRDFQFAEYQ